jgi:hypothetical protein
MRWLLFGSTLQTQLHFHLFRQQFYSVSKAKKTMVGGTGIEPVTPGL